MADKNVNKLVPLFYVQSKFVHMSETWNKRRARIIKTGRVWYKKAKIRDVQSKSLMTRQSFGAEFH